MQPQNSSRASELTAAAAEFLTNPETGRYVRPFVGRECSVGTAAKELNVAVNALLYRVRQMQMQLTPMVRDRYTKLEQMCAMIRGNYARLSSTSQIFVDQMSNRLDGLLQAFLRLANAGTMYTEHMQRANPRSVDSPAENMRA